MALTARSDWVTCTITVHITGYYVVMYDNYSRSTNRMTFRPRMICVDHGNSPCYTNADSLYA